MREIALKEERRRDKTKEVRDAQTGAGRSSSRCSFGLRGKRKCRETRNVKAPHAYSRLRRSPVFPISECKKYSVRKKDWPSRDWSTCRRWRKRKRLGVLPWEVASRSPDGWFPLLLRSDWRRGRRRRPGLVGRNDGRNDRQKNHIEWSRARWGRLCRETVQLLLDLQIFIFL